MVLGIWWFIFQQKRPGPPIPKGSSYATVGFKQIWMALRGIRSLPQTFTYFFAYFMLADGLNTTGTSLETLRGIIAETPQEPSCPSFRMITSLSPSCKLPTLVLRRLFAQLLPHLGPGISSVTSSSRRKQCSWSLISLASSFHFGVR